MDNKSVTIRDASPSDVPAMTDLLSDLFGIEADFTPDPEKQGRGLRLMLDGCGKHRVIRVAEAGGKAVAMCTAQTLISTAEGGVCALVEDLVVHRSYRGRGIGGMLLASVEEWCRTRGIGRIQLLADSDNTPAIDFYCHRGWQTTRLVCLRKKGGQENERSG